MIGKSPEDVTYPDFMKRDGKLVHKVGVSICNLSAAEQQALVNVLPEWQARLTLSTIQAAEENPRAGYRTISRYAVPNGSGNINVEHEFMGWLDFQKVAKIREQNPDGFIHFLSLLQDKVDEAQKPTSKAA